MRSLKLTLSYDGTDYAGWQIQKGQTTVQEVVERAIAQVTGSAARVTASGRTDAGVHALGQVASFCSESTLTPGELQRALNARLPGDVAVLQLEEAPLDFHPIRDAVSKRYRYQIDNGRVADVFRRRYNWFFPTTLDDRAMHRAAQQLVGRHDFSSFQSSGAPRVSTVRTVTALRVERGAGVAEAMIQIEIEADGFLYNMARAITGALVEVGRGAREEGWLGEVLAAGSRSAAGPTAPPQGLFLVDVQY